MKNPLTNIAGIALIIGGFTLLGFGKIGWAEMLVILPIAGGFLVAKDHNTTGK